MDDRPTDTRTNRQPERAFILTVVTFVLLTPPIVNIFDVPVLIFRIPLLHIYCFAVWLAAICLCAWLAPRMSGPRTEPPAGGKSPPADC